METKFEQSPDVTNADVTINRFVLGFPGHNNEFYLVP